MSYFKSSKQHATSKVIGALGVVVLWLLLFAVQVLVATWAYRQVAPSIGWPELTFWQFWWFFVLIKVLVPSAPRVRAHD